MSVEYSREQAEQMLIDRNKFNGFNAILLTVNKEFLNHKFPPKIEYVGKVWKIENGMFLCTSQNKSGTLYGYGIDQIGRWFLRESGARCCCNPYSLDQLTEATPTEWMEALEKFAESKYNVGDEVKCLSDKQLEIIASFNHAVNKFNCLNEWWATAENVGVALLMKDGIWADIITPAKENPFDKLRSEFNEMKKVLEDLKHKEKNKDNRQKFTDKLEEIFDKSDLEFAEHVLGFNLSYPKRTPIIERDEYGNGCIIG